MRTNNVSPITFQATVPTRLKNKLMDATNGLSRQEGLDFVTQLRKVETWGEFATEVVEISSPQVKESYLGVVNHLIKPLKQVMLPDKGSLLKSFMALSERDITNAENTLSKYV